MAVYGTNGIQKFEKIMQHFSIKPTENFAEIGVYQGGVVKKMSTLFPNAWIYAYDTFEGLPQKYYTKEEGLSPGLFRPETDIIGELNSYTNISAIKGLFPETYEKTLKFWTVHLDVDYYESTKICLDALFPNMVSGSAIFIDDLDDTCCYGIRKIHDEITGIDNEKWLKKLKNASNFKLFESTKNQLQIEFI